MSEGTFDIERRKFTKLAGTVGAAGAVGIAGCAGSSGSSNTYRFGLGSEMDILDPHVDTSARGEVVFGAFSEPLFHFTPESEVVPHLLSDYEVLDGGQRYVFTVEDGITFHDGEELTGEVVAWNLERLFSSSNPARGNLGPEATVEETGEMEVEVQYEEPYPILPSYLTYNTSSMTILSKAAYESASDDAWGVSEIVGTGPFEFDEWNRAENIRFTRYDDYDWGPEFSSNQGPSNFEELVIRIIPEGTTLVSEVTNGDVHASNYIPPARLGQVEDADATAVNRTKGRSVISIPFNQEREMMQEMPIRQAISHALNRENILSTAIGGEGFLAYDLVPENVPGAMSDEQAQEMALHNDPDRARQILEEAGWTNSGEGEVRTRDGEELSVLFRAVDIGHYRETAVVAGPMLENVGFDVTIEVNEIGTYWDELEQGNYDIKVAEHWAVANAIDILRNALHTDQLTTPDGGVNYANVQSGELDQMLDAARTSADEEQRQQLIRDIQERLHENRWYHPLYGFTRALGYENELTGTEEFFGHEQWGNQYYYDKLVFDLGES